MSTRYFVYAGDSQSPTDDRGFAGLVGACVEARVSAARSPGVNFAVERDGETATVVEAHYLMTGGKLAAWMR
jgi:hypothetical protein